MVFISNSDGSKYVDINKVVSIEVIGAGVSWQTRILDSLGNQTSLYVGAVQADAETIRDNFLTYVGLVTL
jgi:hypothetical protein